MFQINAKYYQQLVKHLSFNSQEINLKGNVTRLLLE